MRMIVILSIELRGGVTSDILMKLFQERISGQVGITIGTPPTTDREGKNLFRAARSFRVHREGCAESCRISFLCTERHARIRDQQSSVSQPASENRCVEAFHSFLGRPKSTNGPATAYQREQQGNGK